MSTKPQSAPLTHACPLMCLQSPFRATLARRTSSGHFKFQSTAISGHFLRNVFLSLRTPSAQPLPLYLTACRVLTSLQFLSHPHINTHIHTHTHTHTHTKRKEKEREKRKRKLHLKYRIRSYFLHPFQKVCSFSLVPSSCAWRPVTFSDSLPMISLKIGWQAGPRDQAHAPWHMCALWWMYIFPLLLCNPVSFMNWHDSLSPCWGPK